jgi:ketosteroid isomerase-like protein
MDEQAQNIEKVRRLFDALLKEEHDALPELIDENVKVTVLDSPQISGPRGFAGVQGMIDAYSRAARVFESTRLELRTTTAVDDQTALAGAAFTARARRDLQPISLPLWFVFRFGSGKVISVEEFETEASASEAAGAVAPGSSVA